MEGIDYLENAKVILRAAEQCAAEESIDSSFVDIAATELKFLCKVSKSIHFDDPLVFSYQTRVEYVILIVHSILQKGSKVDIEALGIYCLSELYDLVRFIEERHLHATDDMLESSTVLEEDSSLFLNDASSTLAVKTSIIGQQQEDEIDNNTKCSNKSGMDHHQPMDASRSQWLDMALTATVLAMVDLLKKCPSARSELSLSLADSIAIGQRCSAWQMQYLSMGLIFSLLLYEAECDALAAAANTAAASETIAAGGIANQQDKGGHNDNNETRLASNSSSSSSSSRNLTKGGSSRGLTRGKSSNNSNKVDTHVKSSAAADEDDSSAGSPNSRRNSSRLLSKTHSGGRGGGGGGGGSSKNLLTRDASGRKLASTSSTRVSNSAGSSLGGNGTATSTTAVGMTHSSTGGTQLEQTQQPQQRSAAGAALRKSQSSNSFRAIRALRCVDDICKSGYMRCIVWMLLHQREIVRKLAAEILKFILERSLLNVAKSTGKSQQVTGKGGASALTSVDTTSTQSDLWACCVEQGLVPKLEYIQQGISVYRTAPIDIHNHQKASAATSTTAADSNAPSLQQQQPLQHKQSKVLVQFPELYIRQLAESVLVHLVRQLDKHQPPPAEALGDSSSPNQHEAPPAPPLSQSQSQSQQSLSRQASTRGRRSTDSNASSSSANKTKHTPTTTGSATPQQSKVAGAARSSNGSNGSNSVYTRLVNALVHSGNSKLRINIFSSLVYLCGRSAVLGRMLCLDNTVVPGHGISLSISNSSSPGTSSIKPNTSSGIDSSPSGSGAPALAWMNSSCHDMLSAMIRDPAEFKLLLQLLLHFLRQVIHLQEVQDEIAKICPLEIGTQTELTPSTTVVPAGSKDENSYNDAVLQPLMKALEPMVLVQDRQRTTKMVCPSMQVIQSHSPTLAKLLKGSLQNQIMMALQIIEEQSEQIDGDNLPYDTEMKLASTLKNLDDSHFIVLQGSYNVWQEVFSHMVDSFLLQSSVKNMSLIGLLEALEISQRFGMKSLDYQYSVALQKRLSTSTFLQIFQASVGMYPSDISSSSSAGSSSSSSSKSAPNAALELKELPPLHLHRYLVVQCLPFLDQNLDRIVSIWKPKDGKIVVACVYRIICSLLVRTHSP